MAFALRESERLSDGIRRCAVEELDSAMGELRGDGSRSRAVAVHQARKSLKKERALLRMVRPALAKGDYRRESAAFRDAGRRLSAARDADVALETVDALAERYVGRVPEAAWKALHAAFERERDAARRASAGRDGSAELVSELADARARIDGWRMRGDGWELIEGGLETAYRRGRDGLARAERDPSAENRHDWRKRVKDLWYDLRLLEPAWPPVIGAHAAEAHALSELLGEDHDLAVLRDRIRGDTGVTEGIAADLDAVVELIDGRRAQLFEQARLLGRRLYAERPATFVRRMKRYWRVWRAQSAGPAAAGALRPRRRRPRGRDRRAAP